MTAPFIWYNSSTKPTGRRLMYGLGIHGGLNLANMEEGQEVVAWGSDDTIPKLPTGAKWLNSPQRVWKNGDKLRGLRLMKRAGVPVPKFSTNHVNIGFPCIARNLRHQDGQSLWICNNAADISKALNGGAKYFLAIEPIHTEYRVHVFNGKAIVCLRKVKDESTHPEPGKENIRLIGRGWKFQRLELEDILESQLRMAEKATKAVGLTWGAVDIIRRPDNSRVVLEVNSAPGLKGGSLAAWLVEFQEWLEIGE